MMKALMILQSTPAWEVMAMNKARKWATQFYKKEQMYYYNPLKKIKLVNKENHYGNKCNQLV